MNEFLPEKGIHFNAQRVDVSDVLAPPYDVINPEEAKAFLQQSPYNIVKVILPEGEGDAKYENAKKALKAFLDEGVLLQDDTPGFYLYEQTFKLPDGREVTRQGLIGALRIPDQGGVLPHEKTLSAPKEDRFKLFKATGAVPSQVFTFYADPKREVEKAIEGADVELIFDATTQDGVRHVLKRITDVKVCEAITKALAPHELFIADGHHRFETQKNYRDYRRKQVGNFTGDEPFNFASVYVANVFQEGLVIQPINRLFYGFADFDPEGFKKQTEGLLTWQRLDVELKDALKTLEAEGKDTTAYLFVMKEENKNVLYLIKPVDEVLKEFHTNGPLHPAVAALDVSFLHVKVLDEVLGLTPEMVTRKEHIEYEHDPFELVDMMNKTDKYQFGVILNPVKVEQIMAVAEAGQKMPQKSTYFYPKLFSGVVIHPLEEHVPPES